MCREFQLNDKYRFMCHFLYCKNKVLNVTYIQIENRIVNMKMLHVEKNIKKIDRGKFYFSRNKFIVDWTTSIISQHQLIDLFTGMLGGGG